MDSRARELMLLFTDCELILQECRELKAYLSLELQALRDQRKAERREFQEFMSEIRDTLYRIQGQFTIEAELLSLIKPQKAGERKCQKSEGEGNSSQIRTLKQYARKTH